MDKPLFQNGKNGESDQVEGKGHEPSAPASGDKSAAPSPPPELNQKIELNQENWDKAGEDAKKAPWMNQGPGQRLAIRTFSRGLMGAMFFTAGGLIAKKWMRGYDVNKGMFAQTFRDAEGVAHPNHNPLTYMAKLIDTVVGVPIEATVKAVTGDAELAKNAVLFRPTYVMGKKHIVNGKRLWGRSLGHEVVDITFDFFCASVGDAFGRDIVGFIDPNVKKDWIDDKGHVNVPKAVQNALKSVTRYVTYNGGEDWAVSIPYAYFMKGQRKLINGFSPGFMYDFDQAKNGGSFKMGGHPIIGGKLDYNHQSHIAGNYALEGIADLQGRFTVYNIGTLMYREIYDHINNKIHGKPDKFYGAPDEPEDPHKSIFAKAGDMVKWVARSAVKGVIIMTPSVPFFWITRSNQNKHRGLFIHPEYGMMTRKADNNRSGNFNGVVEVGDIRHRPELLNQDVYYSRFDPNFMHQNGVPYDRLGPMNGLTANPSAWPDKTVAPLAGYTGSTFHPYYEGTGIIDKTFNAIGRGQHKVAKSLTPLANFADRHGGVVSAQIKNQLGLAEGDSFRRLTHPFARASMSYTPYMYAKAEFANLWDNGKTDLAAERLIDGVTKFNWHEVKAGAGEVFNAILHKPFADPAREAEADRRIEIDTTPPEVFSDIEFKRHKAGEVQEVKREELSAANALTIENASKMRWQDRVIQGKPEDKPEIGANKPKSYAEQEEMRKALEAMQPPTNSIN